MKIYNKPSSQYKYLPEKKNNMQVLQIIRDFNERRKKKLVREIFAVIHSSLHSIVSDRNEIMK